MRRNAFLLLLILCLAVAVSYTGGTSTVPQKLLLANFPERIGTWHVLSSTIFDEPILKVLRASDYLMRTYINSEGKQIGLYVGYHDGGPDSGPIHSPRNCLPGAGWDMADSRTLDIGPVQLVRALYKKEESGVIYYYWYQVQGKCLTNDFALKIAELQAKVLHGRHDASFIRIHVSQRYEHEADALVSDFLEQAYPLLRPYLPM